MNLKLPVLCFSVALLAALSGAQQPNAFDYHASNFELLQSKELQKEIGITDAQRTKMNQAADGYRARMAAYQAEVEGQAKAAEAKGQKFEFKDTKGRQIYGDLKRNVLATLTPAQLKRLREVSLQTTGLRGLLDDQVAAKVGIPKETVIKMRQTFVDGAKRSQVLLDPIRKRIRDKYAKLTPKDEKEADELRKKAQEEMEKGAQTVKAQINRIEKETADRLMALMSEKQKANWKALLGKPFKLA